MMPGFTYLGVVLGIHNEVVQAHLHHKDGDKETVSLPVAAFAAPPVEEDEFDCWLEDGEPHASVVQDPDLQFREGLGMSEAQIEQLAKELDV